MKGSRLGRHFFTQPTLAVARGLLGKYIVRIVNGEKLTGMISETEAYIGPMDRASHAFGGKCTPRNLAEYMIGGHVYIYLVYGMHWQLNISTNKEGKPECVLIRGIIPENADPRTANGPGKLCKWLKLDGSFYGEDITHSRRLWIEDHGIKLSKNKIMTGPRIGIAYAGRYWASRHWRFYIAPMHSSHNIKTKGRN